MYEGSVLIGYFLGVHVHLAMSDIRSEIIALCCSLCVYVLIFMYPRNVRILPSPSCSPVLCQSVFLLQPRHVFLCLLSMVLVCSMWNALSDCILSSRTELKKEKVLCVIFISLQSWVLSVLWLLYRNSSILLLTPFRPLLQNSQIVEGTKLNANCFALCSSLSVYTVHMFLTLTVCQESGFDILNSGVGSLSVFAFSSWRLVLSHTTLRDVFSCKYPALVFDKIWLLQLMFHS